MHEEPHPADAAAQRRFSRKTLAGTRLGRSPFLSTEERQALEHAASPARSLRAGIDLVREGERTDSLFILAEGWACRYLITRDGARQITALLVPGDTANIDALAFATPGYGVCALTAATVLAIPRGRALALAIGHPGIAKTFAFLTHTDNAILSQGALCLGRHSARQRLAHLLCQLSARLAPEAPNANASSFDLPVTQVQLADALGLTPVHVNRTMQQLRNEGLIVSANRVITVPDMAQLRGIGEFNPAYLHLGMNAPDDCAADAARQTITPPIARSVLLV